MPELVPRRRDPLVIGLLSLLVVLVGVGVYLLAVKPELERRERGAEIARLEQELAQLEQPMKDARFTRDLALIAIDNDRVNAENVERFNSAEKVFLDMQARQKQLQDRLQELMATYH